MSFKNEKTPPGQSIPVSFDTPPSHNRTRDADYRCGTLKQSRNAVLEELQGVPIVSHDWFISNLLPKRFREENKVSSGKSFEDVAKTLSETMKEGRWQEFPISPSQSNLNENEVFAPLKSVIKTIVNAISVPTSTTTYVSQPNQSPSSERSNRSRPDGQFLLRLPKAVSHWWYIVCALEFKKASSEVNFNDDIGKVVWSLHHIMREDARRRFTFGITIEDTDTRFWFASRSAVLVTEPFDFIEDYTKLIRFVDYLSNGTETELGFDDTISRVLPEQGRAESLRIKLGSRTFITENVLADFAADSILGRGTRVWSGYFEDDAEMKCALKDVWIDSDRASEGEILKDIKAKFTAKFPSELFEEYFLELIDHKYIVLDEEGCDQILATMMNGELPPKSGKILPMPRPSDLPPTKASNNSRMVSSGLGPDPRARIKRIVHGYFFKPRSHYRIAFRGIGKPLYEERGLKTIFSALRDTVKAIKILHVLGYVHRDVSTGNILLFGEHGKLTDLEYCKLFSKESSHDVRTGTLDFMAVEVAARRHLFWDSDPHTPSLTNPPTEVRPSRDPPPFRYCTLHDLESLWWICVFSVFTNQIEGDSGQHDLKQQLRDVYTLFPRVIDATGRRDAFQLSYTFKNMVTHLSPKLHLIGDMLDDMRRILIEAYKTAEKEGDLNTQGFHVVHAKFDKWLQAIINSAEQIQLHIGLSVDAKRKVVSDDAGDADVKKQRND